MSEKFIEENTKLLRRTWLFVMFIATVVAEWYVIVHQDIITAIVSIGIGLFFGLWMRFYFGYTIFGPLRQFDEDMENEDYTPRSVWNGD